MREYRLDCTTFTHRRQAYQMLGCILDQIGVLYLEPDEEVWKGNTPNADALWDDIRTVCWRDTPTKIILYNFKHARKVLGKKEANFMISVLEDTKRLEKSKGYFDYEIIE